MAGVQNVTACDALGDELGLVDHKPISHSLRLGFNSAHMVSKVVQYATYDNMFNTQRCSSVRHNISL